MTRRFLHALTPLVSAIGMAITIAWMRPVASPAVAPEMPTELNRIYALFDTLETDLDDYRWPVSGPLATTSVFGDYRSTHFHGGIDLSTQGQEGVPVRAMREGWVSMLRVSPHGYGSVVEIAHEDGFTTWYAHLRNFTPHLDSLVRRRQEETSAYAAELQFGRDEVRVAREEIIAFTGSTGAGGPHLHFEIRDARHNPVNPLLVPVFAGHARDRVAPAIEEFGVVPLAAGTLVQGDSRPFYVRPQRGPRGELRIGPMLRLTGDVGFTVRVRDGVGVRAFRNRMASLELNVDSTTVYASSISRLPADVGKQIALHFDWTAKAHGHPYHQKLFIDQGNRLPFYSRLPHGSGMLRSTDFTEGMHQLEIVARDLNGNESRLHASVIFNHPPRIEATRVNDRILISSAHPNSISRILVESSHDGSSFDQAAQLFPKNDTGVDGSWSLPDPSGVPFVRVTAENRFGTPSDAVLLGRGALAEPAGPLSVESEFYRDFVYVRVRSPRPLAEKPRVRVMAEGSVPDPEVHRLSARQFFTTFPLDPDLGRSLTIDASAGDGSTALHGTRELSFAPITPEAGGMAQLPDGSFRLSFPPSGVLSEMYVRVEEVDGAVRAHPTDMVLDQGADVEMEVPAELMSRRAGLFLSADGEMQLLDWRGPFGATHLKGRVTRFLGTFRILEDETPPLLERRSVSYRSETLNMEFRIRDGRSGVASSTIRVTVDDRPVIAAYDPERRRITVHERIGLTRGRHVVQIRARDKMDNEAVWRGTISRP